MRIAGNSIPSFALEAVKGGPNGLKIETQFTQIGWQTDACQSKLVSGLPAP